MLPFGNTMAHIVNLFTLYVVQVITQLLRYFIFLLNFDSKFTCYILNIFLFNIQQILNNFRGVGVRDKKACTRGLKGKNHLPDRIVMEIF